MRHFRRVFSFSALSLLTLALCLSVWQTPTAPTQNAPLTYPEIVTALNTKLPNQSFKNKTELINWLIIQIKQRKVDKPLTKDREEDLRQAGATEALINAIRANSPPISTPTPTPKPTPTIKPTPTPKTTPTPTSTRKSKEIKNSIGMEFVLVPSGSFMMGASENEKDGNQTERPQHRVSFDYDFYVGKYEVTIGEWKKIMGDLPEGMKTNLDAKFKENDSQPVVRISWNDAKDFIARLNAKNDAYKYRLPSEAEWEYAARAGTQTRFYWGDDLKFTSLCQYANVKDYSDCKDNYVRTAPVGKYAPNAFGLYDMTGNVWEWCEDIWNESYNNLPSDGSANLAIGDSNRRVQRGGSWADAPKFTRIAARGADAPTDRNDEDGFRIIAEFR